MTAKNVRDFPKDAGAVLGSLISLTQPNTLAFFVVAVFETRVLV